MIEDNSRALGSYRYGYQGLYSEEDEKTSWHSFELRQYDSDIGRWNSIDPYGQYASPYVAMGNAPNMMVDMDGGWSGGPIGSKISFIKNVVDWARVGKFALNYALPAAASVGRSYESLNNVQQQNATLVQRVEGNQNGGDKNVPGGEWDIWGVGSVKYLGKAIGGTNFIGPGPDQNPYELGIRPVDEIDAGALAHDYSYWQHGVGGVSGAYNSTDVRFADEDLVYTAISIMERYQVGGIDKVTGLPISQRTYTLASAVYIFFSPIVVEKFRRVGVIKPLLIPNPPRKQNK